MEDIIFLDEIYEEIKKSYTRNKRVSVLSISKKFNLRYTTTHKLVEKLRLEGLVTQDSKKICSFLSIPYMRHMGSTPSKRSRVYADLFFTRTLGQVMDSPEWNQERRQFQKSTDTIIKLMLYRSIRKYYRQSRYVQENLYDELYAWTFIELINLLHRTEFLKPFLFEQEKELELNKYIFKTLKIKINLKVFEIYHRNSFLETVSSFNNQMK